jgi:site-specific DNA recombinase
MAKARRGLKSVVAQAAAPALVRCAIYTRKSTDEGLDKDFNSLDNQRERGEAFVDSQGWQLLPTRYDDGGFSGGTADRPALKQLLADVKAGQIDSIVVYKLDRLSRSLVDFVKIHEFLEKHGVALVSVTESLNTQTPHGRMQVNMLLSFAQYERELAAERTRDKISAARRRGKWTAQQVRAIFEIFAERPSLTTTVEELNRRGWRQKRWTTKGGNKAGGGEWNKSSLRTLLTNPLYIGKQKLRGEVFPGEHRGIVPKKLFDNIQCAIQGNRRDGGASSRNSHGFLLRGLLRCSACDAPMTADSPQSHGRRYRYYRCLRSQRSGAAACPTRSVPADRIEQFVVDQIRRIGADQNLQEETFQQAVAQVKAKRRGLKREIKQLARDLAPLRLEVVRLVKALAGTDGPAADAIRTELTKAQERIRKIEARDAEVQVELTALDVQVVDRRDLARALEEFTPIWDVLLTPEKERVLQLLIDRISYNGATQEMTIAWRLGGFGELAKEVAP